ncbi:hypothetical protein FACS189472_02280 [Alphaproteobacteria bacterium]|nr:hypothetical protein FACS189472_02280 [Alphaproteobacteria bacterium]
MKASKSIVFCASVMIAYFGTAEGMLYGNTSDPKKSATGLSSLRNALSVSESTGYVENRHYEGKGLYYGYVNNYDQPCGKGELKYYDGAYYRGHWLHGYRNGYGESSAWGFLSSSPELDKAGTLPPFYSYQYDGQWENDTEHGHGTMTFSNETMYEGQWENGMPHGHGMITGPNGKTYVGQWDRGVMLGKGTLDSPSGHVLYDAWHRDRRCAETGPIPPLQVLSGT